MRQIILLSLMALMIVSCQKKLSREDAKSQIANHNESIYFPSKHNYEIVKGFIKNVNTEGRGVTAVIGEDQFKQEQTNIEELGRLGLLKLTETPHREETTHFLIGTTIRTWTSVKVTLTETGSKYMERDLKDKYEVNLWETDIKEITGMREMPDKLMEVQYTIYNTKITPFGEIFSDKNQVSSKTAYFSKYDDGWKINK